MSDQDEFVFYSQLHVMYVCLQQDMRVHTVVVPYVKARGRPFVVEF